MRLVATGGLVLVAACNALLGVHDLPADAPPDAVACSLDTDCADHMYCADDGQARACACVAGYSSVGGACQWSGVITDPEFTGVGSAWVLDPATSIDPTFSQPGMLDPGAAQSPLPSVCFELFGSVPPEPLFAMASQSFAMPRLSRAEPLVAEISGGLTVATSNVTAAQAIGGVWNDNAYSLAAPGWTTARLCLGEANYAPESTTGAGAPSSAALATSCFLAPNGAENDYDHFEIVPANPGECPVPGTVTNGDAEGTDGWIPSVTTNSGGDDGASAQLVGGQGQGGTRALQLHLAERCDDAAASTPMSVPLRTATGSPTLSVYHRKTTSGQLSIYVAAGALNLSPDTSASGAVDTYCLPTPMQGAVSTVSADLTTTDSTCGDPVTADAYIDNVALAVDPLCGTDPVIADGGFESGYGLIGTETSNSADIAAVLTGGAYEGTHYLGLQITTTCDGAQLVVPVTMPAVTPGSGPALKLRYRFDPGLSATLTLQVSNAKAATVVRDGMWDEAIVCMDQTLPAGWPEQLVLQLGAGAFLCSGGTALATPVTAGIDAIESTTDPSCAN